MTIGEKIKMAREAKGLTQEQLGALCGTTKQTIFKYENGIITNIPLDRLEKMAEVLSITPMSLMGWEDTLPSNILPLPNMVKKPRLGTIACGKPILAVEDAEEFDMVPDGVNCDFTLKCKGDSMINARIFDGDTVYIRSQPQVENGQIAAVRIGEEATLKKVYYAPGSDRITLRACNPMYADMVYEGDTLNQIQILGLAVGFYSIVRHEQ